MNTALTDKVGPYIIEDEHPKKPIYFARHQETGEAVVLKKAIPIFVLEDIHPNELGRECLEFEAKIQSQLSHPNICPTIGTIEQNGVLYLAMPKAGTYDMSDVVNKRMPVGKKLSLLEQTAYALQHCHEKGIVHLDVKMENVRTDDENIATVIDFGAARIINEPHPLVDRIISYTERTVAPEYARDRVFTKRTDVFSLGYIAYHALTGNEPFKHRKDQIVYEKPTHNPEKVELFGPAGELIIRALRLKQRERPSMDELADAFKEQSAKSDPQPSATPSEPCLVSS